MYRDGTPPFTTTPPSVSPGGPCVPRLPHVRSTSRSLRSLRSTTSPQHTRLSTLVSFPNDLSIPTRLHVRVVSLLLLQPNVSRGFRVDVLDLLRNLRCPDKPIPVSCLCNYFCSTIPLWRSSQYILFGHGRTLSFLKDYVTTTVLLPSFHISSISSNFHLYDSKSGPKIRTVVMNNLWNPYNGLERIDVKDVNILSPLL